MTITILLADDSVTIQKIVELAFVQNGYEVHAVGSGDEAIARLEGFEPDVVIADVHMPGASGYDVCRATKERYPGTPVVLLIGAFESFDPADVVSCGADTSMKKPFDSKDLFSTVESLIAALPPTSAAAEESDPEPVEDRATSGAETVETAPVPLDGYPDVESEVAANESFTAPAPLDGYPLVESEADADAAGRLSDEDVDRIARRVVELLGESDVREVAWEVIPDLAEIVIKDRIRELESQVE